MVNPGRKKESWLGSFFGVPAKPCTDARTSLQIAETGDIIVNIEPKSLGRGPMKFCTLHDHDADTLTKFLEKQVGAGCLYNDKGYAVVPDADWQLAAGEYKYVCKSAVLNWCNPQEQPTPPFVSLFDTPSRSPVTPLWSNGTAKDCFIDKETDHKQPIPPFVSLFDTPSQNPAPFLRSNGTTKDFFIDKDGHTLKSINKANEADLGEALDYLGFEIVDGHMYGLRDERFKLPKPVEGTLKCSTFDPNDKGRNFDKALAEHHKKYLEGLEVPMGKDGYNVLELIHMRGAVDILIGAKRYMGSLASAVVPNITTDLSADHYSRVGFVHMHRNKDAVVISMLAIMFKTDMPLDFVSTDGVTYILYRFHKMKLLKYEQLSAEEAYYAVAERLKKDIKVKIAMPYPIGDLLKEFPEEETMAHRILKEMLPSKRY